MSDVRLSVIVLNYNTQRLLADCLESLYADGAHQHWQIIVVDNDSSDDSVAMVARDYPQATLLPLGRNLGFAAANNRGAQMAKGRHLLFLNADTAVPVGVLSTLCDFLDERTDAAVVGPRMRSVDGELQYTARTFPGPLNSFLEYSFLDRLLPGFRPFGRPRLTYLNHRQTQPVEYVAGACLMICREYFRRIGGWCEEYLFYAEDADLCAEVKKAGGVVYYYGDLGITHIGGASAEKMPLAATLEAHRSVFLFVKRQRGSSALVAQRLVTIGGVVPRLLLSALAVPFAGLLGRRAAVLPKIVTYARVLGLCFSRQPFPTGKWLA